MLQPPDVHRAWLLKPALKFELHPVAYPELVRPAVGPGPLEGNLFPVFGQRLPDPSFRETRVIEPRIGQLPSRCDRTGHEYPGTAIESLTLHFRCPATLVNTVPTFDSNDLIGINASASQKLLDRGTAPFGQRVGACFRAFRITRADDQNPRVAVLLEPAGRSFQRNPRRDIEFKTVRRERDGAPEERRV